MPDVRIENHQILVDGRPCCLRGGEIQYFRLPRAVWRERLAQARDAGITVVSAYMPWFWHAVEEGRCDFDGTTLPERNLRFFLDAVAEAGLFLIARPGPFINSELRYGGLPPWLFRDHPETLSRRADGKIATGRPIPAEGEPVYRHYVRAWYAQIVPQLADYDAQRGGPILMFQPDNELSAAWSFGLLNSLYDPTILSTWWPDWCRRLENREALLKDGEPVAPPRTFPRTETERRCALAWMNFKRWFFADWGATLAQWAIEDGMRVPMVFNQPVAGFYGPGDHAGFGAVLRDRGIRGCTATHTYAGPGILDRDKVAGLAMGIAILKSSPWGGPAISLETNADWFFPRLCGSELNWSPLLRLGLGFGLTGNVIYPFAAGSSDLQSTITGPEYFEPSCVDQSGRLSSGGREVKTFHRFVAAWEPLLCNARDYAELTVGYAPSQRLLDFLGPRPLLADRRLPDLPGGEGFRDEPAMNREAAVSSHDWLDGYEGVSKQTTQAETGIWKKNREAMVLLHRLNRPVDWLELTHPARAPGQGWIALACTGALESTAIDYLLAHLDGGGGCLFFPTIPVSTLAGSPDLRLRDRLGIRLSGQTPPAGGSVLEYGMRSLTLENGETVAVDGWVYDYAVAPGSRVLAAIQNRPVIVQSPESSGRVVVCGVDPVFNTFGSLLLWRTVLAALSLPGPALHVEGTPLLATLRAAVGGTVLVVHNIDGREGPSRVRVHPPMPGMKPRTFDVDLAPHAARCLLLDVDLGPRRLRLATSEVIPQDPDFRTLELHGCPGRSGMLVFDHPVYGRINGNAVKSMPEEDGHVLRYIHDRVPLHMCFSNSPGDPKP